MYEEIVAMMRLNDEELPKLLKSERWRSGGMTGGSCWDDSEPVPVSSEKPIDFEELDELLLRVVPDLLYSDYKAMVAWYVYTRTETISEYYGNYTEYSWYEIDTEQLIARLEQADYFKKDT